MEEIIPNLWISNLQMANDLINISSKRIKTIINCSKKSPVCSVKFSYRVPVSIPKQSSVDNFEYLYIHLNDCVDYIHQKMSNENKVLVCCFDAKQLSPAIIVAYLMKYGKVNLPTAKKYVMSKCRGVFSPDMIFKNSLEMYQKYLIQ